MNALFDELKEGLEEAIQHASGEPTNVRVRAVELPDVAAGRHALGMSHAELASVPLRVIQREPDAVIRALHDEPPSEGEAFDTDQKAVRAV